MLRADISGIRLRSSRHAILLILRSSPSLPLLSYAPAAQPADIALDAPDIPEPLQTPAVPDLPAYCNAQSKLQHLGKGWGGSGGGSGGNSGGQGGSHQGCQWGAGWWEASYWGCQGGGSGGICAYQGCQGGMRG